MEQNILDTKTGKVNFADNSQLASLRIADPVLTTVAQGYTNEMLVGSALFPELSVTKRRGLFPAFGKEAFKIFNTKRALRGQIAKMEVVTGSVDISLSEHSLGFMIDDAELEEYAGSPEQLMMMRQKMVSDALELEKEYTAAKLATDTAQVTNNTSGAGFAWATTGTPISDIKDAKEEVRKKIGKYPNVAVFSADAWLLFINNKEVRDHIKYTQTAIVTEQIAQVLLDIPKIVIGKATYGTGGLGGVGESPALTMGDIWNVNQASNLVLANVENGFGVPSFGYCYTLQGYPKVTAWRDESRSSNVYDEKRIYDNVITLKDAAYLIYGIA